jgi:hypothetical protein
MDDLIHAHTEFATLVARLEPDAPHAPSCTGTECGLRTWWRENSCQSLRRVWSDEAVRIYRRDVEHCLDESAYRVSSVRAAADAILEHSQNFDHILLVGSAPRGESCVSSDVDIDIVVRPGHPLVADRAENYFQARALRRARADPIASRVVQRAFPDGEEYGGTVGEEHGFVLVADEVLGREATMKGLVFGRAPDIANLMQSSLQIWGAGDAKPLIRDAARSIDPAKLLMGRLVRAQRLLLHRNTLDPHVVHGIFASAIQAIALTLQNDKYNFLPYWRVSDIVEVPDEDVEIYLSYVAQLLAWRRPHDPRREARPSPQNRSALAANMWRLVGRVLAESLETHTNAVLGNGGADLLRALFKGDAASNEMWDALFIRYSGQSDD